MSNEFLRIMHLAGLRLNESFDVPATTDDADTDDVQDFDGNFGDTEEETVTVTLTREAAEWLKDHLSGEEMDGKAEGVLDAVEEALSPDVDMSDDDVADTDDDASAALEDDMGLDEGKKVESETKEEKEEEWGCEYCNANDTDQQTKTFMATSKKDAIEKAKQNRPTGYYVANGVFKMAKKISESEENSNNIFIKKQFPGDGTFYKVREQLRHSTTNFLRIIVDRNFTKLNKDVSSYEVVLLDLDSEIGPKQKALISQIVNSAKKVIAVGFNNPGGFKEVPFGAPLI